MPYTKKDWRRLVILILGGVVIFIGMKVYLTPKAPTPVVVDQALAKFRADVQRLKKQGTELNTKYTYQVNFYTYSDLDEDGYISLDSKPFLTMIEKIANCASSDFEHEPFPVGIQYDIKILEIHDGKQSSIAITLMKQPNNIKGQVPCIYLNGCWQIKKEPLASEILEHLESGLRKMHLDPQPPRRKN